MIEKIERHSSEAAELVLLGASLQCSILATLLVTLVVVTLVAASAVSVFVYLFQKKLENRADEKEYFAAPSPRSDTVHLDGRVVPNAPASEVSELPMPTRLSVEALHEDMVTSPQQGLILALRRRHRHIGDGPSLVDDGDNAPQTGAMNAGPASAMREDGVQSVQ